MRSQLVANRTRHIKYSLAYTAVVGDNPLRFAFGRNSAMIWNAFVTFSWLAVAQRAAGQLSDDYPRSISASSELRRSSDVGDGYYAGPAANDDGGRAMDSFRLPTEVEPVSYELRVDTDFGDLTYAGRVKIVVTVPPGRSACRLALNAKELNVTGVQVRDQKLDRPVTVVEYGLVDRNEQLIVRLNDTDGCLISKRDYVVDVTFGAPLRNDMSGYYKSSYKENNVTKYIIMPITTIAIIFYYDVRHDICT